VAGDPWGVLVVPVAGDPGGLLRRPSTLDYGSQSFGYSAPSAWCMVGVPPFVTLLPPNDGTMSTTSAFPLWWTGALVPEGWDRARRAYAAACRAVGHHETAAEIMAHPDPVTAEDAANRGHSMVGFTVAYGARGLGLASRVVLLDLVDGRLVERGGSDGR